VPTTRHFDIHTLHTNKQAHRSTPSVSMYLRARAREPPPSRLSGS